MLKDKRNVGLLAALGIGVSVAVLAIALRRRRNRKPKAVITLLDADPVMGQEKYLGGVLGGDGTCGPVIVEIHWSHSFFVQEWSTAFQAMLGEFWR
jgi:hypothetical protein